MQYKVIEHKKIFSFWTKVANWISPFTCLLFSAWDCDSQLVRSVNVNILIVYCVCVIITRAMCTLAKVVILLRFLSFKSKKQQRQEFSSCREWSGIWWAQAQAKSKSHTPNQGGLHLKEAMHLKNTHHMTIAIATSNMH